MIRWIALSVVSGFAAALLLACPQAIKTAVDVTQTVGCVLQHENEPIAQIVTDCEKFGAPTIQDAEGILAQHRAATARERAAGTLPACDAGLDAK